MPTNHDLAIRWNDDLSAVLKLKRTGIVPIHGFPRHFRCPGGLVAIVSRKNEVKLMFRALAIDGPQSVTLANGKLSKGYIIRSDKRTIRRPTGSVPSPIKRWHATGAFRYFNAAKMRAVLVGYDLRASGKYIEDASEPISGTVFRTHVHGIPGLPRNHPEAVLVEQYVSWMDEEIHFGHNFIREAGLFVDLFNLTYWQLLEAKAMISRDAVRMAIGQLRDYKRYYRRCPSLAVLLPARPSSSCMKLLTDNRIAVIWKTPGGSFSTRRWQAK